MTGKRFLLTALAASLFLGWGIAPCWAGDGVLRIGLVAGNLRVDGKWLAGLDISLEPGWKTYWINPGPTGIAPRLDTSGSENVASIEPLWPTPVRFDDGGSSSVGYSGEFVVPLRVVPKDPSRPVRLKAVVDYGVCEKICVPMRADLAVDLIPGDEAEAETAARISAFENRVPKPAVIGGKGHLAITGAAKTMAGLEIDVRFPQNAKIIDLFASADRAVGVPQKLQVGAWRIKLRSGPHPARVDLIAVADGESIQVPLALDDLPSRP